MSAGVAPAQTIEGAQAEEKIVGFAGERGGFSRAWNSAAELFPASAGGVVAVELVLEREESGRVAEWGHAAGFEVQLLIADAECFDDEATDEVEWRGGIDDEFGESALKAAVGGDGLLDFLTQAIAERAFASDVAEVVENRCTQQSFTAFVGSK